jgi:hypothetical protein
MRRSRSRPGIRRASLLSATLAATVAVSCVDLDTSRPAPPPSTLGQDIYGALCDRLGSSVLAEDATGRSYQGLCHFDARGLYADVVDESALPPASGPDAESARGRALAKMHALASYRSRLVRAFDAMLPDEPVDRASTPAPGDTVAMHDALFRLGQTLAPLYESNPIDPAGEPLFPSFTRAFGATLGALVDSPAARGALSRQWGRKAYRPYREALGVLRPILGYPELRPYLETTLPVLLPEGRPSPELARLLAVAEGELASVGQGPAGDEPIPKTALVVVDAAAASISRPRSTAEVVARLLLDTDASDGAGGTSYIVARDPRGFAVPIGSVPGLPETLPSPFAPDPDGFARVDELGRFLDAAGNVLAIDAPFAAPYEPHTGTLGSHGRLLDDAGRPRFEYLATSRTALSGILSDLRPLLDPDDPAKDAPDFETRARSEAVWKALAGAHVLFGPRDEARWSYAKGAEGPVPPGQACSGACASYSRFRGESSPFVDLVHALGPVLADEESDTILAGIELLLDEHEARVARLLRAVSRIRALTREHDEAAEAGAEPAAGLAYEVPIWDEVALVLDRISERPALFERLLASLGQGVLATPRGGAQHFGDALARFMRMSDRYTYDPANVGGPGINVSDDPPSVLDPHHPVDQASPKEGNNRSILERSLALMHDVNGARVCNKEGASLYLYSDGLGDHGFGSWGKCELFSVQNLAGFYFDVMLPDGHPKRAKFPITDDVLVGLIDFAQLLGIPVYDTFDDLSGLQGLGKPTIDAFNRFMVFGAPSTQPASGMWDLDTVNAATRTSKFISGLMNPVASVACGDTECESAEDTIRIKDYGTAMASERLGYFEYLQPTLQVFAEACDGVPPPDQAASEPCNDPAFYPYYGEQLFVDILEVLHRHWSPSGVEDYELIAADAAGSTELVLAIVELASAASDLGKIAIPVRRGPHAGEQRTLGQVFGRIATILFSQRYAADHGIVDRKGNNAMPWVDGSHPDERVTVFDLVGAALRAVDERFEHACDGAPDLAACKADVEARRAGWKEARSALFDTFLGVPEGEPPALGNPHAKRLFVRALRTLREQVNARCPEREVGGGCAWAREQLPAHLGDALGGPLVGVGMDLVEALRRDDAARAGTGRLLAHLLEERGDEPREIVTTAADLLQLLPSRERLAPALAAVASAAGPGTDEAPSAAVLALQVLAADLDGPYDEDQVLFTILARAVEPSPDGSPIEVLLDAMAAIHRVDADAPDAPAGPPPAEAPLTPDDYREVYTAARDFLLGERRGLEQFYYIVQNRQRTPTP